MKVGTLTFHSTDNYGAVLQAYALPKAVEKLGHECQVIDYRHPAFTHGVEIEWPRSLIKKYGLLIGSIKSVNRWRLGWFSKKRKDVKFNLFIEKKLPLSPKTYRLPEELSEVDYDAVLFGSDQIWNQDYTGGIAKEYYGYGISGRKIAYAGSSGTDCVPEETIPLLKEFSSLGIREQSLTDMLVNHGLKAKTVLDPVLLLTREQWMEVAAPLPKGLVPGKYILVYGFDEQPVYDMARTIAKKENLPMVIVRWCGYNKRFDDMIQLPQTGPEEFLSLVANAAAVCTSSFHGTAFSILFSRKLYCCMPYECSDRTISLLQQLGLMECLVHKGEYTDRQTDYAVVQDKLELLREASVDFLKRAIEAGE